MDALLADATLIYGDMVATPHGFLVDSAQIVRRQ
jgi:hypothetical protein